MTVGSLFSGIGGIDLGLERAGMTIRWQVEKDDWCRRVLSKHWPDVPKYKDITTLTGHELERVDVLAGGFPCQPASVAGSRKGNEDVERWLWPHFEKLIRVLRPRIVLVENVTGLFTVNGGAAFGEVIGGLASMRYDCEWEVLSARDIGAPHLRNRLWIVATNTNDDRPYRNREDEYEREREEMGGRELTRGDGSDGYVADTDSRGCDRIRQPEQRALKSTSRGQPDGRSVDGGLFDTEIGGKWETKSRVGRVADGIPGGVDGDSRVADTNSGISDRGANQSGWEEEGGVTSSRSGKKMADTGSARLEGVVKVGSEERATGRGDREHSKGRKKIRTFSGDIGEHWEPEPNVGRVAHGVPRRVDRLRGLGNAVVPQIVEWIGKRILLSIGDMPP